jgi:hypothetical protein
MTIEDDDRSGDDGVRGAVPERGSRRRRTQVAAAVAGFAILGAGAYAITAQVADSDRMTAQDVGVIVPAPAATSAYAQAQETTATAASPSGSASISPAAPSEGGAGQLASPSPSNKRAVEEEIKKAREKAAQDGHPLQRAITKAPGVAAMSEPVASRNVPRKDGSLRITTAKFDLTGQRELLWVADKGKSAGDGIHCTQNFKFSNNNQATVRPTMMVCWRTSPSKSVVTVLVDRGGKPSAVESAEVIKNEWAKLG